MLAEDQFRNDLIALAERAAVSLAASMDGQDKDSPITTNVSSLLALASTITELAKEVGNCGGTSCMGHKIDNIKIWVSQQRFDIEKARAHHAVATANRYAAALEAIVNAAPKDDLTAMLTDWQSHADGLRDIAHNALLGGTPEPRCPEQSPKFINAAP